MTAIFDYKIFKEHNLIFLFFYGTVNLDFIKTSMRKVSNDPDFSTTYHTISDFTDSDVELTLEQLDDYHDFTKNDLKTIDRRKAAYLTSKPNEVVLATLYSMLLKKSSINAEAFSTIDAALGFLSVKKSAFGHLKLQFRSLKDKIKKEMYAQKKENHSCTKA